MAPKQEYKWNIDINSIKAPEATKLQTEFQAARMQMKDRTKHHELYGLLAKNKSIHDLGKKGSGKYFSEGSTQYILRKSLAETIQRVPDGELTTQYDKASKEHIWNEYIFDNKVMWSEFEGIDMLSNLTDMFKMAFIYCFAPVRTGFEKDFDDDIRISFNIEHWADVFVNPDCKDIRRAQTVWHREYISQSEVEALLTPDGIITDSTYNEDTVKYILDHQLFTAKQIESEKLADRLKGATADSSVELFTRYDRGAKEFVTYVTSINAVFRRVPNYDPRRGIPWNFFVLETDKDFPLGVSQVEFLLADQQFNDLFQTSAFKNLLLAMEPPIMVGGWETNPSSYVFEPRKIWNLGNNPNQVKVEQVKVDNQILSTWATTREQVAASMSRSLNVMGGEVARDAAVPGMSKTPQGVEQQMSQKTVNINQYQKRVEYFVAEWANQAQRMYINAMGGKHELTVDETTRRKLFDIGEMDLIDGNKITIDFDLLGTDLLEFKVRTGSLVQKKEDQEREALAATVQPFIQNLNGWSDENKAVIENEVLLPAAKRMLELSDTDIGQTLAESLTTQMAKQAMAKIEEQQMQQGMQLEQQGQQMAALQNAMPPEIQAQLAQEIPEGMPPVPPSDGAPAPISPFMQAAGGELSPSSVPMPAEQSAGQQVIPDEDLLFL